MYAIVKVAGTQIRVSADEVHKVPLLPVEVGSTVRLNDVLMIGDGDDTSVGTPIIAGASVTAEVLSHGRGKKVRVFTYKRRKDYKKMRGHRQDYTEIVIRSIDTEGKGRSRKAKASKESESAEGGN